MAGPTYSVTLHHLAPGAKAAGLSYPDEQLASVAPAQLVELLHALSTVAAGLTIYEPANPEIRVKTDREVFIIRTRYRRLCFVGRETVLRGEEHSIAFIMANVSGLADTLVEPTVRPTERPSSAHPVTARVPTRPGAGFGLPEWFKAAVLLVVSFGCVGAGVWLLFKPPRGFHQNIAYLSASESNALISKAAGEYRTGTQEGDRRIIIGPDGTLRIAKFGPAQAIAEESIRTSRGAAQNGQTGLATNDPYLIVVRDPETVIMYGQPYKRVPQ